MNFDDTFLAESIRMHPNVSECVKTGPNEPENAENLRENVEKLRENVRTPVERDRLSLSEDFDKAWVAFKSRQCFSGQWRC